MILNSEPSLIIIAQALEEYHKHICDDIDSGRVDAKARYDYESLVIQVDRVLDTVEAEYELLRKKNPAMVPFVEILRYKR